jgi:hypothetical protein
VRVGQGSGVALTLQQEFGVIHASRYIRGEHQQEVHLVGGTGRPRLPKKDRV